MLPKMARETGLEPATSGVTGRRSNQLSYSRVTRMCPRGTRGDLKGGHGEVKDVAMRRSISAKHCFGKQKRPPRGGLWLARNKACQRICDVPELVITTGLPALITWVDWAVWL